jgi:8-oxo-dGTP diphosphatase
VEFEETPDRIDIALAIPVRDNQVLVARRSADQHLGGLWEFPGGRIDTGEEPAAAARREMAEETSLRAGQLEPLVVLVHDYADRPLRFHVFLIRDPEGEVSMDRPREWAWKDLDELDDLKMPEANRPMLRALKWRLSG